ncbi:alpha/beta hydrolase [Aurantibacter sp.]|uniref:alpha/beta fold hydrolase n=1 Tax=Aurantibacter sp. TaxID=2807103 RepID=UPI0032674A23
MQKIIKSKLQIVAILVLVLSMNSCTKENLDINELNETIFVRHKKADMPAYIHGNASDKVFLIILHGGPGGNGLWYRLNTIRTDIEKNNAVVYFDQRGHNNAQGNYSEKEVSVAIMAEDIVALAKVIKKKYGEDSKVFLMGHSWGGTLGTATLLKNQEEFSGWIDVAGVHDPKGLYQENKISLTAIANEQIVLENSVAHWRSVLNLVQNSSPLNTFEDSGKLNGAAHEGEGILEEDKVINEAIADYGDDVPSDDFSKVSWNSNKINNILVKDQGLFQQVSFTERLSEITLPSIVLWGKYDLVVPAAIAQEAFDNLGSNDKELFMFQKSAHNPMLHEPQLFSDKVIAFINRHK